ncbi:hypothetical protein ACX0G9_18625 [Flavitalea flava]
MKSVLLPTDLTLQSLYPIHEICQQAVGQKCNIYIIHTLYMPSGIMDLLFLQDKKPYDKLEPQFSEALEMLRKKYAPVINILSFEFVWGNSRGYLRNYMTARNIQAIYLLKDYDYKQKLQQSVKCIPALVNCKLPLVYVHKTNREEYGTLTTLLYREDKSHARTSMDHSFTL